MLIWQGSSELAKLMRKNAHYIVYLRQEIQAAAAQDLTVLTQCGTDPLVHHETNYVDHII